MNFTIIALEQSVIDRIFNQSIYCNTLTTLCNIIILFEFCLRTPEARPPCGRDESDQPRVDNTTRSSGASWQLWADPWSSCTQLGAPAQHIYTTAVNKCLVICLLTWVHCFEDLRLGTSLVIGLHTFLGDKSHSSSNNIVAIFNIRLMLRVSIYKVSTSVILFWGLQGPLRILLFFWYTMPIDYSHIWKFVYPSS